MSKLPDSLRNYKPNPRNIQVPQVRCPPDEGASSPDLPKKPPDGSPSEGAAEPTGSPESKEEELPSAPSPRHGPTASRDQTALKNPLRAHSLRGDGAKLEARAADTKPLLGDFVMQGQATMIYAQPNAGKTLTVLRLCLDAIEAERIDPDNLFYINADDSERGLAEKVRLLEEAGAHVLAPSRKGLKHSQFSEKLQRAADEDSARGTFVIIDTLKKFTNLMDKRQSSDFAQVCRSYVMAGGTIIALGHTAKSQNSDKTPRYQGTTDILEDFDAVYVAEPMTAKPGFNEKVIRFTQLKSRAEAPDVVAYAYSTEAGLSYREKVASLRPVYPEELDGHSLEDERFDENSLIAEIRSYICRFPNNGQEKIVKAMSNGGDYPRAAVRRVLDRRTGTDPNKHLWNYRRGDRGVRNYYLLTPN